MYQHVPGASAHDRRPVLKTRTRGPAFSPVRSRGDRRDRRPRAGQDPRWREFLQGPRLEHECRPSAAWVNPPGREYSTLLIALHSWR